MVSYRPQNKLLSFCFSIQSFCKQASTQLLFLPILFTVCAIIAKNTGLSDFEINYKADVPSGPMRRLSMRILKLFVTIEIGTCS